MHLTINCNFPAGTLVEIRRDLRGLSLWIRAPISDYWLVPGLLFYSEITTSGREPFGPVRFPSTFFKYRLIFFTILKNSCVSLPMAMRLINHQYSPLFKFHWRKPQQVVFDPTILHSHNKYTSWFSRGFLTNITGFFQKKWNIFIRFSH